MGWYREAFSADYLARYAHRDDGEAARAVSLALELCAIEGVEPLRLFDLCCGGGRHLAALMEGRGAVRPRVEAVGGDLSAELLGAARARPELDTVPLLRLDMRAIPLRDASFDVVTNFFTAFGYFESDEENFSVFSEVARILRPGGFFVLDFLNGAATRAQLALPRETEVTDLTGLTWRVWKGLAIDGRRSLKIQRPASGDSAPRIESVRLFTRDEFQPALASRGLEIVAERGDYDGSAFVPETSPRYFVVARRT